MNFFDQGTCERGHNGATSIQKSPITYCIAPGEQSELAQVQDLAPLQKNGAKHLENCRIYWLNGNMLYILQYTLI